MKTTQTNLALSFHRDLISVTIWSLIFYFLEKFSSGKYINPNFINRHYIWLAQHWTTARSISLHQSAMWFTTTSTTTITTMFTTRVEVRFSLLNERVRNCSRIQNKRKTWLWKWWARHQHQPIKSNPMSKQVGLCITYRNASVSEKVSVPKHILRIPFISLTLVKSCEEF